MNLHGRWSDARDDETVRAWARRAFEEAAPHASGSGYVNFLTEDEAERVAASYGANHGRLQAVKRQFDPGNLFRMNLNIVPAGGVRSGGWTPSSRSGAAHARSQPATHRTRRGGRSRTRAASASAAGRAGRQGQTEGATGRG